ncbi:copper resistance system multicopper oxidase [Sphingosinicella sp.]|uniref:copper resistance system multicopper oxidase n=1 Tax=Sphingosinicella sp. TaxID=1917971 RepID=UPI0035B16741
MTGLPLSRRALIGGIGASALFPAWARSGTPGIGAALSGPEIRLNVGHTPFTVGGRTGHAVTVNGTLPAPLIRLKEGERARLIVTNHLDEDTSIHWHGLLLPFQMDGVPGISFPGIAPHSSFTYEFPVIQAGTYWYHSHSNLQEAMGHYGPIVIDPADADPVAYDREHVIVLSDWSFMHPHAIMKKLKQDAEFFRRDNPNFAELAAGKGQTLKERLEWGAMRMSPADISDVTGATYTYLVNGHGPAENWTGLFNPGERVRLRIINASAMTIFNVRIPGLPMTVVNADGENVRPVETDELQISVAETYDVIVTPGDAPYTLAAESVDRSGMAHATLAPRMGMSARVPKLRERPTLSMKDMGHGGGDHAAMGHSMKMRDPENAARAGVKLSPGVDMIAPMAVDRVGDRGLGLEDETHRVLVYTDLVALAPNPDTRPPSRTLEIHLTSNMERYMWSFNGEQFSPVTEPFRFERNERVRVTLVNDTMMAHPIHLHGHFFEVVNGHDGHHPRKHTVNVLPGGKVSFVLTADAPGDWAFHCHLLMHMHLGMFNVVTVRPLDGEGGAA